MGQTQINLVDATLTFPTLVSERFNCPMTLDALTSSLVACDKARVILFVRYGFQMPRHIQGVTKCGI